MPLTTFRIAAGVVILAMAVFVALSPAVVYAPAPRVVLFFLVAFIPALLFGAEVSAQLKLQLPGLCFTVAGVFAFCLGALFVMEHLAKPEEKIAVFQVVDQSGQPVN